MAADEKVIAEARRIRREILEILTKASETGDPCPTDVELADAVGCAWRQASRAVLKMVQLGQLLKSSVGSRRTLTIVSTGRSCTSAIRKTDPRQLAAARQKRRGGLRRPDAFTRQDEMSVAVMAIRRKNVVCYAERKDEKSTKVTGYYIVGRHRVTPDKVLAFARGEISYSDLAA